MSSVAQIVQKIIDDLSDGISQLVLLVVVLQEQNADVPPQLPSASAVVVKTAQTLVKIARNLADNNYKAFPDIQKEIHDAAGAVEGANKTMTNAVNHLSTSTDRISGWSGLVEACRIMSGKTIRLLQIVYGAELKRLFATADQLLEGFDDFDPSQAKSDPNAFSAKASDLATKANQLGTYIANAAKDEEAPGVKKKLQDLADKLKSGARGLINDANDLLADPDNPQKKKKVQDAIDDMKDLIADARKTVQDNQTTIPDAELEKTKAIAPKFDGDPFQELEKLKKQCDKVGEGAKKSDPKQVKDQGSEVPHLGRKAVAGARGAADKCSPKQRQRANDAIDELEKQLPQQVKTTDNYLRSPTPKKADDVADEVEDTKDVIDNIIHALRGDEADPVSAIDQLIRTLGNMDNAATSNPVDSPKLNKNTKKVPRQHKNVVGAAKDAADQTRNPKQKKQIQDALDRVQSAVPRAENTAKKLAQQPTSAPVKDNFFDDNRDAIDALEDLKNAIMGDPLAAIDRLLRDMDGVENAGKRGDAPKLDKIAKKDIPPHSRDVQNLCKDAADKCKDPLQRKRINDALSDLARQLPKQNQAIQNSVRNPTHEPTKKDLVDDTDKTKDILQKLKRAILGLDPNATADEISPLAKPAENAKDLVQKVADTAKAGNKNELPNAVGDCRDGLNNLKKMARDTADKVPDKEKKQQIYDTIDDLDDYFPREVEQARDVVQNPQNKPKANDLQKTADTLKDLIDELVEDTKPALADDAARANKKLDDLVAAKKSGNEPEVKRLMDDLDDLGNKISDSAKHLAAASDTPAQAKAILDAVEDLDDNMGDLNKDVHSKAATPKVVGDAGKVKNALCKVTDATAADPLAAIDKLLRTLGKVDNANKADDMPKVKKQGVKIPPQGKDVVQLCKEAARKCDDPAQKKQILEAVEDVDDELPFELEAVKNLLDNPRRPEKKKDLADETDELRDRLNKLKDALLGKQPRSDNKAVGDVLDAVNQLQKVKPKLAGLIAQMKDKPGDSDTKRSVSRLMPEIEPALTKIQNAVLADPEDETAYAAEVLKEAVDKLLDEAKKGNAPGTVKATKDLSDAKQDLDRLGKNLMNQMKDPERKKDLGDALNEINKNLPTMIKAAKNELTSPNDANERDLDNAARAIKRAADKAAKAARPISPEQLMIDAQDRMDDAIGEINDAAKRGDKPALKKGFNKLKDAGDDFNKAYKRCRGPIKFLPPRDEEDPMAELKKLWNKFGVGRDKLTDDPKNKKNQDDFKDWGNALKKANDKALQDVKAKKLKPVRDVQDAIDRLDDAVRRGDRPAALNKAKDLVAATNNLNKAVANEPDAPLKRKLQHALEPLTPLVKEAVKDTKDWIADPNNKDKKAEVKEDADKIRAPLAAAEALICGTPDKAIIGQVRKALADCADVHSSARKNPKALDDAIDQLTNKGGKDVSKALRDQAHKLQLPEYKRQQMLDAADDLDKLLNDLKNGDKDRPVVDNKTDKIEDQLNKIIDEVEADETDDIIRAKAKANTIMATLGGTTEDMDNMSLLEAAQDLSDVLGNMMNMSMGWARNQGDSAVSDKSRKALDLDSLLASIEGTNVNATQKPAESLDSLLASLDDLNLDRGQQNKPASKGDVFQEAIEEVAEQVTQVIRKHHGTKESKAIADTLKSLANAARNGERQKMIMAGRTLAAQINQFIKVLKEIASRVASKNPMYQDRLIKFTHALKNYATQMKILISVKASSIETDADSDESLASITRSLGSIMSEAVTTMDIVKVTILKERN